MTEFIFILTLLVPNREPLGQHEDEIRQPFLDVGVVLLIDSGYQMRDYWVSLPVYIVILEVDDNPRYFWCTNLNYPGSEYFRIPRYVPDRRILRVLK